MGAGDRRRVVGPKFEHFGSAVARIDLRTHLRWRRRVLPRTWIHARQSPIGVSSGMTSIRTGMYTIALGSLAFAACHAGAHPGDDGADEVGTTDEGSTSDE